jgi:hypothetical protein
MVDELAQVRDKLRALTTRETHLKKAFREDGAGMYRGIGYQIEIGFSSRGQLDMDAVRAALGEEWIRTHTKQVEVMNIRQMELI